MIQVESLETLLNKENLIVSEVTGYSMYPFLIPNKHKVIIAKTNKINLYDCILYKDTNNKYILHRVIDIKDNYYVVRGDNTLVIEKIPKENVLGILTQYYDLNNCIDVDYELNKKYYNKSIKTLPLRKFKHKIKSILIKK